MRWAAALLALLLLAACGGAGGKTGAESALEAYLRALVEKDEARLVSLTCPDWEADALLEFDSFQAVKTELKDLSCKQTSGGGEDPASVKCQGEILATYGNEVQSFALGGRTYRMVPSGADWQVCGYTVE